ncbi:MAG: FAD-binding oxidoreductase [Candidatus Competibacter sp.]|nr:FAD-binding oxidoreductase [Candidatus Competibacter sp.]MDG4606871.1 FAD-binding oxidoreductase [Candidatus Contendobacter sp.]HRD48312.1 FAD-binding oxidoreductase [Candidatus Contendobacter sp.]
MNLPEAFAHWQTLLGAEHVLDASAAQIRYGADTTGAERRIAGALRVRSREQIPALVRIAHECRTPLYPISTGRNWGYGTALPVHDDGVILDLSGLAAILDFDAELGVVTLEPGVTQALLAEFLDRHAHPYLVPVTGAGPQCSLIGNALERGYGVTPHTDHFAAVTDLEAVLADGSVYQTRLHEVAGAELASLFKWGIGPYFPGLFTQSGFGIVTRMSIALTRKPDCVQAFLFSLKDDSLLELAVQQIQGVLARLPGAVGAINLMNQRRVLAMSAPFPAHRLDAQGLIPAEVLAELGRAYQILPWTGFGTLYGAHAVARAARAEIRSALRGVASRLLFVTPERAERLASLARWLPGALGGRLARSAALLSRSLQLVAGRPNETALPLCYWRADQAPPAQNLDPARDGCGLIWYAPLVPMKAAKVRDYVDFVTRTASSFGVEPLITLTSLSDKVFDSTVPLLFERASAAAVGNAQRCYAALMSGGQAKGFFPYRVGVDSMRWLAECAPESADLGVRLKAVLDPHRILAPGRYESG